MKFHNLCKRCVYLGKRLIGITGGSGFIGSSLATFLSQYYDVRLLDVKPPNFQLKDNISFNLCDIRNFKEVEKSLEDVDLVIHAAIVQIPLISDNKRFGYEVNFLGTENVCRVVENNPQIKGFILSGSWHTIGERELKGMIDEEFGFRPDKVEERARLYALSKIAQESIVRFYDEMSDKVYGIIRMGTVLGEGMPEKTAASIFVERGLREERITPFKHSMYRPMLYVDIEDVCKAYEKFAQKIFNGEIKKGKNSIEHIVNIYYPKPITILELAKIVQKAIIKHSHSKIRPNIEIVDTGQPLLFAEDDVKKIKVDISKAQKILGIRVLKSPEESIDKIVKTKLKEFRSSY